MAVIPAALQPYITSLVPYREVLSPEAVHLGIPSPTATMIVAFDEPLDVSWLATPEQSSRHWVSVAGLHLAPALIHTHGFQHGIQVALTPLGVRALCGLPVAALHAEVVASGELPLGLDPVTHAWIADGADADARIARLTTVLMDRLRRREAHIDADLRHAWSLLEDSGGTLRIAELADRVGWSRRHLVTRFTAEYGLGPKQAARLFRFEHVRRLLTSGTAAGDAAAIAGFADQAHLAREYRALAGQPATRSLATPYTNLQDLGLTGRAASVS